MKKITIDESKFVTRSMVSNPHQNTPRGDRPREKPQWVDEGNGYMRRVPSPAELERLERMVSE